VVEKLRLRVEAGDRRKPATDQADVDDCDHDPGGRARQRRVAAGEHRSQHHAPSEGDGHVGGATGDGEACRALRARQEDPSDGARRGEHVAACCRSQGRGRHAAQGGAGGARHQAVAQDAVRWMASVRRRP
jgi:hypothetical protein